MKTVRLIAVIAFLTSYISCVAQDYPTVYCHTSSEWSDWNFTNDINDKTQHINIGGTSSEIADYTIVVPNGVTLEMGEKSNGCRARKIIVEEGGYLNITSKTCQAVELVINGECFLHSNNAVVTMMDKYVEGATLSQGLYVEGTGTLTIPNRDYFNLSDDSPILKNGIVREFDPKQYNGYRFYSCDNGDWNNGEIWSLYPNVKILFYDIDNNTYHYPGYITDVREEVHVQASNEVTLDGHTTVGSVFVYGILHVCGTEEAKASVNCTDQWVAGGVHEGVITVGANGVLDLCENASLEVPLGTITINGEIKGDGNINGYKIDTSASAKTTQFIGTATENVDRSSDWGYFHNNTATFVAMEDGSWDAITWGWQSECGLVIANTNIKEPLDNQGVTIIIPENVTINQIEGKTENAHTIINGTLQMCVDDAMWDAANQYSLETIIEVNGILEICDNSIIYIDGTLQINPGGLVISNGDLNYKRLINNGTISGHFSEGEKFQSTQDGNWADGATWNWAHGRTPNTGDIVIIKHRVTIDPRQYYNAICQGAKWIVIEGTGSLTLNNITTNYADGSNTNNDFAISFKLDINDKGNLTINTPLVLAEGATLKAMPGATVDVNSHIKTNKDGQIIISNSSDLSTSFYLNSGCKLDNKVKVERGLKKNNGYTAGSATLEGTINEGLSDGDLFYSFDAEQYDYSPSKSFAGTFKTAQMQLFDKGAPERIITQIGTLQQGDKTYNLKIANGENYGWNLIQNPFTTAIGIADDGKDLFVYDNEYIDPVLWFYINMGGIYQFVTYSLDTDVEVPTNSEGRWADNIAPQQGFFVKANDKSSDFTIKYPKKPIARTGLKSLKAEPNDVLRLTLSSDEYNTDEMAIVFRNGSENHIQADAEKKWLGDDRLNQIYGIKGDFAYSIPVYPNANEMKDVLIPIGMQISNLSTECTISALNIEDFKDAEDVLLYDNITKEKIDLRSESYTFTTTNQYEDERFFIIVSGNKVEDVATDINKNNADKVTIRQTTDGVSVDVTSDASLKIYDISGREMVSQKLTDRHNDIKFNAHGICLVEVISKNGSISRKKILK